MWALGLKLFYGMIDGALLDPWWRKPPHIFCLARNKDGRVSDFWVYGENTGSWNVNLRKRLNDWEVEEIGNLLRIIDPIS